MSDVFYIDTSSIKKVGNNAYYFRLADYIIPNNNGELSAIIYFETNCNDLSFRYAGGHTRIKYEDDLLAIVKDTIAADITFI